MADGGRKVRMRTLALMVGAVGVLTVSWWGWRPGSEMPAPVKLATTGTPMAVAVAPRAAGAWRTEADAANAAWTNLAAMKRSVAAAMAKVHLPQPPRPIPAPFIEPTRPAGPPPPLPQLVLTEVLGPGNLYHDDAMGVSATYPEEWRVADASRWGENNAENTVALLPGTRSSARPVMYYENYPNGYPELEGPEAYFRRMAQIKENHRAYGWSDYQNVPESFEFTQIDEKPAFRYAAVYTQKGEVYTEHFTLILGRQSYVMFVTPGKMEDVHALLPQLRQMEQTVKVP